jgi:uncharacterized spore protein YtfJ
MDETSETASAPTTTSPMDVQRLIEGARDAMTAKRVYGDPVERDGTTVIPAARVRGGGGGGSGRGSGPDGEGEGSGSGAGFGLDARPVGAYVIRDGAVEWQPAVNRERITLALIGLAGLVVWALRSVLRRTLD